MVTFVDAPGSFWLAVKKIGGAKSGVFEIVIGTGHGISSTLQTRESGSHHASNSSPVVARKSIRISVANTVSFCDAGTCGNILAVTLIFLREINSPKK